MKIKEKRASRHNNLAQTNLLLTSTNFITFTTLQRSITASGDFFKLCSYYFQFDIPPNLKKLVTDHYLNAVI
jgi:hypothetical protein